MGGKHNITQYRERLDKALASDDLIDEERLKALVKNQLIYSSRDGLKAYIDDVVDRRTKEVSNFLDMLRSASAGNDVAKRSEAHVDWKLKQDTEDYRVMYREGPKGSPYHTLLVEGYIDGPLDICLCISMESNLYKKWWPQTMFPPFKIVTTECVQKVGINEQISLVRMKVPWPVSAREALVHYFVFEYFQDDIVIVLLTSLSDLESIKMSTHGFDRDGLPDPEAVRVDVVGGFALQKVSDGRSYFRTIVNMDIKVDFVPPAFINFISRQLIGSGFRLYQKEVASVSKGDEDFAKALKDPLYAQIREALYSENTVKEVLEPNELYSDTHVQLAYHAVETSQAEGRDMDNKVLPNGHAMDFSPDTPVIADEKVNGEIQEIKEEEIAHKCCNRKKREVVISSEVNQALGILEKAISIVREYGRSPETRCLPATVGEKLLNFENNGRELKLAEDNQGRLDGGNCEEMISHEANSFGSKGSRLITSPSEIAPASLKEDIQNPTEAPWITVSCSSVDQMIEAAALEKASDREKTTHVKTNGITENILTRKKSKKSRQCCWYFTSGQQMV
ncbi:Mitotic checkpoint serine/threonine-protein kinase BUB1 [Heracleum sosnowskyi]|uniref:Mitotic checkpoint serine/threonine-protein kinase BUB1 n=1 Tax=Heracleum sosnowskyi TaxID=360622 RepID=A0AAD8NEB2_9APIA|nr:Mitotic checkpoint serine/threonine-protein kinase BUB1 [Heracleum sosnowskyi]